MATATRAGRARSASKKTRSTGTSSQRRLRAYRAKRDLKKSGEPGGGAVASAELPRFVIQKHDATRLHYDLRLEMEGVYRSWAVPKGMPTEPGDKTLAIEVEDHPLDYGTFEGVIPPGNYGAGTVMLWDRGNYSVLRLSPERAYRDGKIHFALAGQKCVGEWTLVRMRSDSEKTNWLLIKNEASKKAPMTGKARDLSVASGRSLEEIAGKTSSADEPSETSVKKKRRTLRSASSSR